jgi:xanthine/CO dehydrogenase XdhC/CoxF family maturation factor
VVYGVDCLEATFGQKDRSELSVGDVVMSDKHDPNAFDVVLPDGRTVQVVVEARRMASEVAEAITRKTSLTVPAGHKAKLCDRVSGVLFEDSARDVVRAFAEGRKIDLRVVPIAANRGMTQARTQAVPMTVHVKDRSRRGMPTFLIVFLTAVGTVGAIGVCTWMYFAIAERLSEAHQTSIDIVNRNSVTGRYSTVISSCALFRVIGKHFLSTASYL